MRFNPDEDYVTVGGRLPLKYMQDGYGFTVDGVCLGRFDDQGEAVADEPVVESEFVPAEPPGVVSDREALETLATDLGISFRSNISDEKLAERIKAAQEGVE